jgi:hypothetical protein
MAFIGTVGENGTVTLPPEAKLPVGTKVSVEALKARESVWDLLKEFDGKIPGPGDSAVNHDYYAHGAPKRHE